MRVLAISPHTDDAELAAGASIARWLEEGASVTVIALSTGAKDTGANRGEFEHSMSVLGISDIELYKFTAHNFPVCRQEILQLFIDRRRLWNPTVVLCPASFDVHQDHATVHAEAVRAFRQRSTILGYDLPWNTVGPHCFNKFVHVEARHIGIKSQALQCYISQEKRPYMQGSFPYVLGWTRGLWAGVEYAEAFEVIRWRE